MVRPWSARRSDDDAGGGSGWRVRLVGRADVGSGWDDLVDPVENVVGEQDLRRPGGRRGAPWCGAREGRWSHRDERRPGSSSPNQQIWYLSLRLWNPRAGYPVDRAWGVTPGREDPHVESRKHQAAQPDRTDRRGPGAEHDDVRRRGQHRIRNSQGPTPAPRHGQAHHGQVLHLRQDSLGEERPRCLHPAEVQDREPQALRPGSAPGQDHPSRQGPALRQAWRADPGQVGRRPVGASQRSPRERSNRSERPGLPRTQSRARTATPGHPRPGGRPEPGGAQGDRDLGGRTAARQPVVRSGGTSGRRAAGRPAAPGAGLLNRILAIVGPLSA